MAKSDKKEADLAVKAPQETALAVNEYADDAGAGFDNQTTQDLSVPFLAVLQDGSPQVKPRHEKYVEGAKSGSMMNTISNEIYDGDLGLIAIPVITDHCFVEWKPDRGGFVQRHELNSKAIGEAKKNEKNRLILPSKNELVETFYMYSLIHRPKIDLRKGFPAHISDLIDLDDEGTPILIPFASTKIKPYKKISTMIHTFKLPGLPHPQNKPPFWCFPLWFSTVLEKRDAGDSNNYKIEFANGPNIEKTKLLPKLNKDGQEYHLYSAARRFYQSVRGGTVKVDFNRQNAEGDSGKGGGEGTQDVPF